MKIIQVVHSFLPVTFAGTEVYCYALSKELSKKHEVSIFCRVNDSCQKEYELRLSVYNSLPVYTVNNTFNWCKDFEGTYYNAEIDRAFSRLLDELKPDIIHIQHLLFLSLGIVREAKKRGIPVVFTVNDYWLFCPKGQLLTNKLQVCSGDNQELCVPCIKPQLCIRKHSMFFYHLLRRHALHWLLGVAKRIYFCIFEYFMAGKQKFPDLIARRSAAVEKAISQIDLFIAPSIFAKNLFIKKGVAAEKIITCRYGIANPLLLAERKGDERIIRFGYAGTLLPMKGVDLLIKAFCEIPAPNARLLIYGKAKMYAGYESFYEELKRGTKGDPRISFMGEFNNGDIGDVLSNIDVLVVPSIWLENTPLVILEALAAKVPVIASRIGGIPELIKDRENGLLFTPQDNADLEKKLNDILITPGMLGKLRAQIKAVKSIEENTVEVENIYNGLRGTCK